LIVLAIGIIILLFFIQNKSSFKNQQQSGLTYNSNELVGNLVNKDTDGDGIPDWEESLWGTDPTKKETTPGILDSVAIQKMKLEKNTSGELNLDNQNDQNLTQTDKFSRELFSTVATLNQTGAVDQNTIDKLSDSLNNQIQNSTPRKVYALSDLHVIAKQDLATVKKYNTDIINIYKKYPIKGKAFDILKKFTGDGNNVDSSALTELDPIINQTNKILFAMTKTDVPEEFSTAHLNVVNGLERVVENLNDIKLYDTDPLVSLKGISQYEKNSVLLVSAFKTFGTLITLKLES